MKKLIFTIILASIIVQNFAQVKYYNNDSAAFIKAQQALNYVVKQSDIIIEAIATNKNDYYYIKDEDQTYYRGFIKVTKVIKGKNISFGDTIIILWKQEYKGNGPDERRSSYSSAPRLWYIEGKSTSCLFLTESNFPIESVPDEWSQFKYTTYIPSTIGYFAALYDSYMGFRETKIAVHVNGLIFNHRYEWYDYLRTFPDINLPNKE